MDLERRAVIDVGTNSIKLLLADLAGADVRPILEESRQTRLGHGFYAAQRLEPARIAQTAETIADFAKRAREHSASAIRLIATSAAREASNSDELKTAIQEACGLHLEIISGDEEADLAFRGVRTDPSLAREPLLVLEVGGGSTQFILGHHQRTDFRQSFPVGSVRLLQKFSPSDPPSTSELAACRSWLGDYLGKEVRPKLLRATQAETSLFTSPGSVRLIATGGAASILGCMEAGLATFNRARIEAARLPLERLRWHVENLWRLPLEERQQIVGLPKNRADVILTGAAIYEAVMEHFEFRELRISTRGLRFGAVLGSMGPAKLEPIRE